MADQSNKWYCPYPHNFRPLFAVSCPARAQWPTLKPRYTQRIIMKVHVSHLLFTILRSIDPVTFDDVTGIYDLDDVYRTFDNYLIAKIPRSLHPQIPNAPSPKRRCIVLEGHELLQALCGDDCTSWQEIWERIKQHMIPLRAIIGSMNQHWFPTIP